MFSVKVHKVGQEVLVACCDANILGKKLTDGDFEFHVNDGFYGGEILGEEEFEKVLGRASSANIIGDKAVELAVVRGYVDDCGVTEVCGIKHAQLFIL